MSQRQSSGHLHNWNPPKDPWKATERLLAALETHWLQTILSAVTSQCTLGPKFQAHWIVTGLPMYYYRRRVGDIIVIKWSHCHLIFILEIPNPGKTVYILKWCPGNGDHYRHVKSREHHGVPNHRHTDYLVNYLFILATLNPFRTTLINYISGSEVYYDNLFKNWQCNRRLWWHAMSTLGVNWPAQQLWNVPDFCVVIWYAIQRYITGAYYDTYKHCQLYV